MKYRFIGLRWTDGVGQLTGHADSAGQAGAAPLELTSSSPTQISSLLYSPLPPSHLLWSRPIASPALDTCPLVW